MEENCHDYYGAYEYKPEDLEFLFALAMSLRLRIKEEARPVPEDERARRNME